MAIPTQYGSGPTLGSIFAVPTEDQVSQNPDYWAGYARGASAAAAITPSAAGTADWFVYMQNVASNYMPAAVGFFPIANNVGWNNALQMAGVWEWQNDPNSGHNKVIS